MKKFIFLYKGNGSAPSDNMEEVNKAWFAWFTEMGDAVIDMGNPFDDGGKAVTKSGVTEVSQYPTTGYTLVNAKDMETAIKMAGMCPLLDQQGGEASVEVYEALPM